MFPTVYLCLMVPGIWGLAVWRRRPRVRTGPVVRPNLVLQCAWLGASFCFLLVGSWVISFQDPDSEQGIYRWTGFVLGGAFVAGATLMGLGVAVWWGRLAWCLRVGGWLLIAFGALVPSILTLTMPLVALSAFSLRRSDSRRHESPPAASLGSPLH